MSIAHNFMWIHIHRACFMSIARYELCSYFGPMYEHSSCMIIFLSCMSNVYHGHFHDPYFDHSFFTVMSNKVLKLMRDLCLLILERKCTTNNNAVTQYLAVLGNIQKYILLGNNCILFIEPRCPWGPIYGSWCHWLTDSLTHRLCADLTDATLADDDSNSIPTDDVNKAILGNVAI